MAIETVLNQPERTLRKAIIDGLAYYATLENIDGVGYFYQGQSADEISQIKDFVRAWDEKHRIIIGYPRSYANLPMIAIVLRGESETDAFLGNLLESRPPPGTSWRGTYFRGTFGIGIFTQNADLTVDIYRLIKHILMSKRLYLERNNVINSFIRGSDVEPNPEWLPANVFLRYLDIEASSIEVISQPVSEIGGRVASFDKSSQDAVEMQEDGAANMHLGTFTIEQLEEE